MEGKKENGMEEGVRREREGMEMEYGDRRGRIKSPLTKSWIRNRDEIVSQWRFYVGARGHRPPKSCPGPQFLDTVVLLLVELTGSIINFA